MAAKALILFGTRWLETSTGFAFDVSQIPAPPFVGSPSLIRSGKNLSVAINLLFGAVPASQFQMSVTCSAVLEEKDTAWVCAGVLANAPLNLRIGQNVPLGQTAGIGLGMVAFDASATVAIDGGDIAFNLANISGEKLLDHGKDQEAHPLLVFVDEGAQIKLDLLKRTLTFSPESIGVLVDQQYETTMNQLQSVHISRHSVKDAVALPLDSLVPPITLKATPLATGLEEERKLLLNMELENRLAQFDPGSGGNSAAPALEVVGHALVLDLLPHPTQAGALLHSISAIHDGGTTPLQVKCHATSNARADTFRVGGDRIELKVRAGSPLAENAWNMPGLVIDTMTVTSSHNSLHGAVFSTWGNIGDAGTDNNDGVPLPKPIGDLKLAGMNKSVAPAADGSVPYPNQILPHAFVHDGVPALVRTIAAGVSITQASVPIPIEELRQLTGAEAIVPLMFSGGTMEWPLIDIERLRTNNLTVSGPALPGISDILGTLNVDVASAAGPTAKMQSLEHVSKAKVSPAANPLRSFNQLLSLAPAPVAAAAPAVIPAGNQLPTRPSLAPHSNVIDFGLVKVVYVVPADGQVNNPIVGDGSITSSIGGASFTPYVPSGAPWFNILFSSLNPTDQPTDASTQVCALLKLDTKKTLSDIIHDLKNGKPAASGMGDQLDLLLNGKPAAGADPGHPPLIDQNINQLNWTGLIVLNPQLGITATSAAFATIMPEVFQSSSSALKYLALTAQFDSQVPSQFGSVYGALYYEAPGSLPPTGDASYLLKKVDLRFADRKIVNFDVNAEIQIKTFWSADGRDSAGNNTLAFDLTGRYEAASAASNADHKDRIAFEAKSREPMTLSFPPASGPFKQIDFKAVRVYVEGISDDTNQQTRLEFDGDLVLQKWQLLEDLTGGMLSITEGDLLQFAHLGLPLPKPGSSSFAGLKFHIPSLSFPVGDARPLNLGPLRFRFTDLGLGKTDLFDSVVFFGQEPAFDGSNFPWACLDIQLCGFPLLSSSPGKPFGFQLLAGHAPIAGGFKGFFGLKGLDFEGLTVDLLGFMSISADEIKLDATTNPRMVSFVNVKLKILQKVIIDKLTVILCDDSKSTGFAAYMDDEFTLIPGVMSVQWLLLCNNVYIGADTAKELLSLDTQAHGKDFRNAIATDAKAQKIAGSGQPTAGKWGFGIGFTILGDDGIVVKLLVVDAGPIGLMVKSTILSSLGIAGLSACYVKGNTPQEDRFIAQFKVANVYLEEFNFLGGIVAFEAYLNGGFLLDLGFPWMDQTTGQRLWSRAFGANVDPYIGHGGFYFRYTHITVSGDNEITIGGGYAIAAGLGIGFDFGVIQALVSIEVYAVLEGSLTIGRPNNSLTLTGLTLAGTVGIIVQGHAELNVWILHARVDIYALAEAGATLLWNRGSPALLNYNFRISAGVSASCEVGFDWCSFTFSVSMSFTMPFQGSITL